MESAKDKFLKKKQVAEQLSCSLRTIDRVVGSGRLPKIRFRGSVRFRESDVRKIINEGIA
jgi:excisionase family DNA binding protein